MAPEDQSDTSQQTAASDGEQGAENQSSPAVIEINDSMTECEEEARPSLVKIEEKAFIARLHSFMKDRATPIERIPHLGFKQINLWRIYKAVDKLGGYDSVTARRLWKKVYDELGGSPGSTSAATCTRRHYEKLVLPFERYLKGEEDKPLPPSKPRKPYKRSLDSQVNKVERKRKRSQMDNDVDPEILAQRSPDTPGQSEAVIHPRRALWSSDPHHPDASQPNRATTSVCTTIYTRLVPVPVGTSSPWSASVPSTTAEVISPLEKKKRMAQASLNGHQSPQSEDKERPSVIHCSPSPSRASSSHNSTDGSPMPLSSSSSRSPSPYSVSSEDGPVGSENKPVSPSELPLNCSSSVKNSSSSTENSKSTSCTQPSKDSARQRKDVPYASTQSGDSIKVQNKDSAWRPIHRGSSKYIANPFLPPSSYVISDWPTSTSSFTKVIPKSTQLPRPAPIRPSCKIPQGRLMQQDDSLTSVKKQNNMAPWIYPTEKREKSRTMLQKVSSTQQSASHSAASLRLPSVLSRYEKSGRDPRHQHAFHPVFLPNRMRLPHPQFMYHNVPTHSAIIGSAVYPHPYSIPLLNPQLGYTLPAMSPIYQHKM